MRLGTFNPCSMSSSILFCFRRAEEEYEALVKAEESRMTARGYRPKVHTYICAPLAKHITDEQLVGIISLCQPAVGN